MPHVTDEEIMAALLSYDQCASQNPVCLCVIGARSAVTSCTDSESYVLFDNELPVSIGA